jgi:hypothetical protein
MIEIFPWMVKFFSWKPMMMHFRGTAAFRTWDSLGTSMTQEFFMLSRHSSHKCFEVFDAIQGFGVYIVS